MENQTRRLHEIDLLKGAACYLMLIGHALRARSGDLSGANEITKVILYAMDFSGPMFFVASGMNVCTFWDRNRQKKGFAITRFYLLSALLLFVLGYTYNLSIWSISFGVPDIFQGVAVCIALHFLIVRFNPKAYVYILAAAAVYAIYLPFRLGLDPTLETLRSLPFWRKQLFVHFSLFPWAVFFLLGAAIHRTRGRAGEIVLGILFSGMIAASLFLEQAFFANAAQLFFRCTPGYVLQTGGGAGLLFLALRHLYRGPGSSRILSTFELAGRESLLFLILHYFFIILTFLMPLGMYPRAVVIFTATALAIPAFARQRDRMAKAPNFIPCALAVIVAGSFLGFALSPGAFFLARIVSFAAALAFAFVFGELRAKLRARLMPSPPTMPRATGGLTEST